MTINGDRRLIEDYLPIEVISKEASLEKSRRRGHISTLHLWWARRPLSACRAAIYGALIPASHFASHSARSEVTGVESRKQARDEVRLFVAALCKYPGPAATIAEARQHIAEAHANRLSRETGKVVSTEEVIAGRAPRPKILDMFAGGGSIPLEALRLGCDAYALDLNPVAHIVELCTLVYPQKYGRPDPNIRGMTGPENAKGEGTWGGLAGEVAYWGTRVLERVKAEIGDLYPPIPDPTAPVIRQALGAAQLSFGGSGFQRAGQQELAVESRTGTVTPVAYLWTRTVRCKNPSCGATVPLVRQTWLCKKTGRYVAFRLLAPARAKIARFEVVEASSAAGLGFDPEGFSKAGNATCPFCGTVAGAAYVRGEASAKRMGQQMMGIACVRSGSPGKVYVSAGDYQTFIPDEHSIRARIRDLCARSGLTVPSEPIEANPRSMDTQHFGFETWGDLFTPRQLLSLLSFVNGILAARQEMEHYGLEEERTVAVVTSLACVLDKQVDLSSTLCTLEPDGGRGIHHTFARQSLPMVWDFAEGNPLNAKIACWRANLNEVVGNLRDLAEGRACSVFRGSASSLPWSDNTFDAIITDPPYYDNVSYSNLSDFFYVWLKRTVGHLYPEHFATDLTPKRGEIIAASYRHAGDKNSARQAYETMMSQSLREAHRVLKDDGILTIVYAHKTTLGWSTLVDALRRAEFTVTEAWPLDTETTGRLIAHDTAALASSIFLVARKRVESPIGLYDQVRPDLEEIVRERVGTLWDMGISGADLVIAAVGAGLRAFTRFACVEYANGEEMPAEHFLREVEGVALETLLEKIFAVPRSGIAAVDAASRFYVLWRFTYRAAEVDAGEAIVFALTTGAELDGPHSLSAGPRALLGKKGRNYRLLDFNDRGSDDKLGLPDTTALTAPLIDILHRALWLMEYHPAGLASYLNDARPNTDRLRLIAQALAGPALQGAPLQAARSPEQVALAKMLANWRSLVEENLFRQRR